MAPFPREAPGAPGIPPTWTPSAKGAVGTARGPASRVWYTLRSGALDEVYFPRVDRACTRSLALLVTDGRGFLSDERQHARHVLAPLADGVPGWRLVNTCERGHYRLEKTVLADPRRDALLQHTRLEPLKEPLAALHLYVHLEPHLDNHGTGNTAWVDAYKGVPMLFAERPGRALALACSAPWRARTAGFVGRSDGWTELVHHHHLRRQYARAVEGNVALTGEVDVEACGGDFVLALAFGDTAAEAALRALASLQDGFERARERFVEEWEAWQRPLRLPARAGEGGRDLRRTSLAVLRTHHEKAFPGGLTASLSIPWGDERPAARAGGYHLVWSRDLVEAAGALLVVGQGAEVRHVLHFLQATQEEDGHWPQNMWLDGTPFWGGVQLDETALPILLVDLARREGAADAAERARLWPMVRRAAGYLVRNGPVTPEDRWEADPGYSPFTLAATLAALLVAADLADEAGEAAVGAYLRETADCWNAQLEKWVYTRDSPLARQLGLAGHYVRITPPEQEEAGCHPERGRASCPAGFSVGPDALALVRFGLRAADDPRILDTVRAIDALLRVDTPSGPAWRRYPEDRYGEYPDGRGFDGDGVGRPWPLLTGERAHYALAAGRPEEAVRLLRALEAFASEGGMIPEQVWDAAPLRHRALLPGRPSRAAMPLVWAHAEYVKLCRSLQDGRVFDTPPQTVQRYLVARTGSPHVFWRHSHKTTHLPQGRALRVELLAPAEVAWWVEGGAEQRAPVRDSGLGVWWADVPTGALRPGEVLQLRLTPTVPAGAQGRGPTHVSLPVVGA